MTAASDSNSAYTYGYDSDNRLQTVNQAATTLIPVSVTLNYGYDGLNNRISLGDTISGIGQITYSYDGDHHLTGETWNLGPGQQNVAQLRLAYDARNRLSWISRSPPNTTNLNTTLVYDADDNVLSVSHAKGSSALVSFSYDYDGAHRVIDSSGPLGTQTYGYDNKNQLTQVQATVAHLALSATER